LNESEQIFNFMSPSTLTSFIEDLDIFLSDTTASVLRKEAKEILESLIGSETEGREV